MSSHRRVQCQPAFILHHRPFRDSSQILDVLTRDHGKIALVARGSRGSRSRLAGILRPFLPLRLSWLLKSELGTLTGAEAAGAPAGMSGDALLAAYYVNELLMNFLHRYDPQPEIFALYANVLDALVQSDRVAAVLRSFEIELLSLLGYAVNLSSSDAGHSTLDPLQNYEYRMEQGLVAVDNADRALVFTGATFVKIAAQRFSDPDILRAANRLLRDIIAFHLGGKELKSRKVMREMRRNKNAPTLNRSADGI